jgi:hypothetical protein
MLPFFFFSSDSIWIIERSFVKLFIIFDGELLGSIRLVATYVAIRFPWLVHTSPFSVPRRTSHA